MWVLLWVRVMKYRNLTVGVDDGVDVGVVVEVGVDVSMRDVVVVGVHLGI